jgi:hypothetical protein
MNKYRIIMRLSAVVLIAAFTLLGVVIENL